MHCHTAANRKGIIMQNVVIRSTGKLDFRAKEAYKTLRTNLEFTGKKVKVIALTSCTPSEGKTNTSFQLALSMAESGKRTILVDADLRRSVMRGRYKVTNEEYGLSHYLSGQNDLEDVICSTNAENFYIIFAGPVPPNPSELLGNDNFRDMIEQLRREYDYVIIDTPPLGSVIDGAVVASKCDGAVIVIEAGAVSYKFAQNVKAQLEKTGCRILGCVLNKVDMNKNSSYYGKHYGNYYGRYYGSYYGREEAESGMQDGVLKKTKKSEGSTKTAETGHRENEDAILRAEELTAEDIELTMEDIELTVEDVE